MFPPCVQNIHSNLSAPATSLLWMSVLIERVKPSGDGSRDESKDKEQQEREERDVADSGKVFFSRQVRLLSEL